MDREEILAKSRKENRDEGLKNAENRGRKIGFTAFSCVFFFIVFFNLFCGKDNYVPIAMFWAFVSAEAYPKYKFTKDKSFLITTICGAMASFGALLCYVASVLG